MIHNYPMRPEARIIIFPYWDNPAHARFGIPLHKHPRAAFHGDVSMAQVGWQQLHDITRGLSVHLRHGCGRGGSRRRVVINRFGWSPIEHVTQTLSLAVEQIVAIARSDYFHPNGKRRSQIAMYGPRRI